jgi:hypothetical protein
LPLKLFCYLSYELEINEYSILINELTTLKTIIMKKVLLFGLGAIFSVALIATSCSKDDDESCVDCTDGEETLELCWEEGNAIDFLAESVEFMEAHPNAVCDEADVDFDLGF